MQLIDRNKIDIPRTREQLIGGLIYVPLADVVATLDAAPVVFDEADMATLTEALWRQVRLPIEWEEIVDDTEDKRCWVKVSAHCPTCHTEHKRRCSFCHACGQALEWEEGSR